MATLAAPPPAIARDDRFFLISALLMTAVIFAGFSFQLSQGRSTFVVPPLFHLHAVVFMGWVALYLAQTALATVGPLSLHRKLGWVAAGWVVPMVILGPTLTAYVVRAGQAPFFFQPQQFLIGNAFGVLAFAGLTSAAVVMRRRTDWHRRLHLCGMASLLGPGLGRLAPMPLLEPFAFQTVVVAGLVFPVAGIVVDWRRGRGLHPAWLWGIGAVLGALLASEVVAHSPVGDALYRAVTAGAPGAHVAPMAFPPQPGS